MPAGMRVASFVASRIHVQHKISTESCPHASLLLRVAGIHNSPSLSSPSEGSTSGGTPLGSQGPYASKLKTRGVIRFDGPEVFHFLQGLLTNDVSKLQDNPSGKTATPSPNEPSVYYPPLYTAMLNSQGRFMYDLFLYRPIAGNEKLNNTGSGPGDGKKVGGGEPALLADVDAGVVDEIMAYLKKLLVKDSNDAGVADEIMAYLKEHILRAKVEIHDISNDFAVWQYYGGRLAENPEQSTESEAGSIGWGGTVDESALTSAEASDDQWRWYKDPRLSTLGLRGLFPSDAQPPLVESGEGVGEDYYLLWRLEQGVPEGSVEIPKGEAIPLEYNLAGLKAISFDKGCYVGQELVARTHHRGVIRKRLMPLNFVQGNGEEAQQAVSPGADVVSKATGKKIGKVTTVLGPRGLGLLRLESALQENSQLQIENQGDVMVKAVRPKWWPSEWGREDNHEAVSNS